jgi:Spy/CpxP family protein refolding chaperone
MSRSLSVFALTVLGAMLVAVSAYAQPNEGGAPGGRGRGMGGPGMLLRSEQIQKELKLTDEQKEKVKALAAEPRGNRQDMEKKIAEILKPEQVERLKQIRLQMGGAAALANREVVKALGLSDDQVAKLKAIQDAARAKMQDVPREERRAKMAEMRKETMDKAIEVLTPPQREKYEKLKGAKIDIDFSALRQRRP